jgi:ribosomal protection tetracycline resistance protein
MPPYPDLSAALAAQTQACKIHPVYFGSAITGAGIESLRAGIAELLPSPEADTCAPLSGAVFKVERGAAGEQDPLIALRQDDLRGEIAVSLYGEVQKEVIRDTLAADFRLEAEFAETTPICIERLVGEGSSLWEPPYPFMARVGLRVAPRPPGEGVEFKLEVEVGSMPAAFFKAVEDAVRETLGQGLNGWDIPDAVVAMTHVIRYRHFATSTPADHRRLTPLALMQAVKRAGTVVCEPIDRFTLAAPERCLAALLPELAKLEAEMHGQASEGRMAVIEGEIAVRQLHALQQRLPGLTQGEGVLETTFSRHRPAKGDPPVRARTDANPLDIKEYLQNLARRL